MSNTGDPTPDPTSSDPIAAPPPLPPAGWYDDGSGQQRWFDGTNWTEHVVPQTPAPTARTEEPASAVSDQPANTESALLAGTADVGGIAEMTALPSAESGTQTQSTTYQFGEVVNGYRLVQGPDGSAEWVPAGEQPVMAAAPAAATKTRRTLLITLGSVGAVLLLLIVIGAINRPTSFSVSTVADTTSQTKKDETSPKDSTAPKAEMVSLPSNLIGMTAGDAEAALTALGLKVSYSGDATSKVASFKPNVTRVEKGSTVTLTLEQVVAAPPEPKAEEPPALTLSQKNAVGSALSYLAFMSFSRSGLIGQLEYEGYSTDDATFAVDYVAPDWYDQAAKKAQEYLDFMSFSRDGLYEQLLYEGFTSDEAEYGLVAVGY